MAKTQQFADDEIVVCFESFGTGALPGQPVFGVGTRVRGDHPAVKIAPQYWAPDGTPTDELARRRVKLWQDAEAPIPPPPTPRTVVAKPIRDRDALVKIRGRDIGARVHRNSEAAKTDPDGYVPVIPANVKGIERRDALVALANLSECGDEGKVTRTVYAGQWVARTDRLVEIHPTMFKSPTLTEED